MYLPWAGAAPTASWRCQSCAGVPLHYGAAAACHSGAEGRLGRLAGAGRAGTRRTLSWRALAEEALSRLRVAGRDFAHGRRCKRPQGKMYMPPRSPQDTRPDALGRPTPGSQQHHWLKRARQWLAQRAVAVGAQALCAVLCFPPLDLRHVPERIHQAPPPKMGSSLAIFALASLIS